MMDKIKDGIVSLTVWSGRVAYLAKRRLRDESGQGLVEYGLIIGLVAIAAIVGLGLLGKGLGGIFQNISGTLTTSGS
ncbi:Flp family type IVb pilin [Ferroacidibacillus organovorans]|nr:Flp family type IVb pilin [Ferroacidibacillus organovorans]